MLVQVRGHGGLELMVEEMKVGDFTRKEVWFATWMHDQYELISEESKWNTQNVCKVSFDELPVENRIVMLRLARRIKERFISDYCCWCGANVVTGEKNG